MNQIRDAPKTNRAWDQSAKHHIHHLTITMTVITNWSHFAVSKMGYPLGVSLGGVPWGCPKWGVPNGVSFRPCLGSRWVKRHRTKDLDKRNDLRVPTPAASCEKTIENLRSSNLFHPILIIQFISHHLTNLEKLCLRMFKDWTNTGDHLFLDRSGLVGIQQFTMNDLSVKSAVLSCVHKSESHESQSCRIMYGNHRSLGDSIIVHKVTRCDGRRKMIRMWHGSDEYEDANETSTCVPSVQLFARSNSVTNGITNGSSNKQIPKVLRCCGKGWYLKFMPNPNGFPWSLLVSQSTPAPCGNMRLLSQRAMVGNTRFIQIPKIHKPWASKVFVESPSAIIRDDNAIQWSPVCQVM